MTVDPLLLQPTPSPTRPAGDAKQDAAARSVNGLRTALAKCNADKASIAAFISEELQKFKEEIAGPPP